MQQSGDENHGHRDYEKQEQRRKRDFEEKVRGGPKNGHALAR
jgi:hypothetical protein